MKPEKVVAEVAIERAGREEIEEGFQIKKGAIVDVEWLDECVGEDAEVKKMVEMLCPSNTIGKVISADEKLLCVATTIKAAEGIDLVAIPIQAIEYIKVIIE